jgi:hypothetical protein
MHANIASKLTPRANSKSKLKGPTETPGLLHRFSGNLTCKGFGHQKPRLRPQYPPPPPKSSTKTTTIKINSMEILP